MTARQWAGHAPLPDQATLVTAATHGFFKSLAAEHSLGKTIAFKLTTPLQASFLSHFLECFVISLKHLWNSRSRHCCTRFNVYSPCRTFLATGMGVPFDITWF
jgi:hypothetical protein